MTSSEGTTTVKTRVSDINVRAADGLVLRGRWWHRSAPRGVLVIAHGYGEHGGCYRRVAEAVCERAELDVIAVDFRGHGRSPGRRGVVGDYEELTDDLLQTLGWVVKEIPGLDRFVLGHSNGGQVALRACLRKPAGAKGLILSNPVLRVSVEVPPLKLKVARFLARHAPWVTLKGNLNAALLTRDPEIQEEHRTDPLRHSRMQRTALLRHDRGGENAHGSRR